MQCALGRKDKRRAEGHSPNPPGSGKWEMPIRLEQGNREKTPDRAVGSLGHLGYLTCDISSSAQVGSIVMDGILRALRRCERPLCPY